MEVFNSTRLDNAQPLSQTESSLKKWSRDEELARFLSISKGVSRLHSAHTSHTKGRKLIAFLKISESRQINLGDMNATNHPHFCFTGII